MVQQHYCSAGPKKNPLTFPREKKKGPVERRRQKKRAGCCQKLLALSGKHGGNIVEQQQQQHVVVKVGNTGLTIKQLLQTITVNTFEKVFSR